jgi:hypothetical protein
MPVKEDTVPSTPNKPKSSSVPDLGRLLDCLDTAQANKVSKAAILFSGTWLMKPYTKLFGTIKAVQHHTKAPKCGYLKTGSSSAVKPNKRAMSRIFG